MGDRSPAGSFDPALVVVALRYARRLGARTQDAEDIAQEALLKLLTYGRAIDDPVAWLYVVVRRLHRRQLRRLEKSEWANVLHDPWPEVELSIDARSLLRRVSDRARRSVYLSLAGYSEREAAQQLGCSVKATEKSLHKTRRRLRLLLRQSS